MRTTIIERPDPAVGRAKDNQFLIGQPQTKRTFFHR